MKIMITFLISFLVLFGTSCTSNNEVTNLDVATSEFAVVQKVTVSGNEGGYTFSIALKSPDKGCSQYANWWEVITENEALVYRRILGHSHVNEQPFTRSGGVVSIGSAEVVIIRGHMNTTGYGEGEVAMKGSVESGFETFSITSGFAADIETINPQPTGCTF